MSHTLYWEPVKTNNKYFSDELKYALRKRFEFPVDWNFTSKEIDYLEGLRDAGIKDADKLINAIDKYGEVHVYEEC